MLKKKMLLGAAVLTFAVGSAFATKAMNHQKSITVFYKDAANHNACTQTSTDQDCITGDVGCTQNVNSSNPNAQLYLTRTTEGVCQDPLQHNAQ